MVDTALEVECSECSFRFWYDGDKINPQRIECPRCNRETPVPEDG